MAHISFSGMKLWNECPYKYKLAYIDKVAKFEGNIYTAFGSAMHTVCEKNLLEEWKQEDSPQNFIDCFFREIERLPEGEKEKIEEKFVEQMIEQGKKLAPEAIPYLKEHFGDFEILSSEENLMENIEGKGKTKFKGFVDLFIKTSDDKYHVIDWKTCSWGWDSRKRTDPMVTYQLTLYKHFLGKKHNIDPKSIETHFALLKRTAKKDHVEIFRVTSGPKKTNNALTLLDKALFNIEKGFFIKNRLSCQKCDYYRTQYCK